MPRRVAEEEPSLTPEGLVGRAPFVNGKETHRLVRATNGRALNVTEGGDPSGWPIFVLHGTPLYGRLYPPHLRAAASRGVRLIGYDRPGYGGSDPSPGRTVADAAGDVAAIADALDVPRFAVWGHSGGGPHALACAATLTDRLSAVAASASIAPREALGLDWLSGMGEGNVGEFRSAAMGREPLLRFLEPQVRGMMHAKDEMSPELRSLLSPVDLETLNGELGTYLGVAATEGLASGLAGWVDDDLAFVRPWRFELDHLRIPVSIWHGKLDQFVPYAHGVWLGAHIPNSELKVFDFEGHLSLFDRHAPDIFDWLLARRDSAYHVRSG